MFDFLIPLWDNIILNPMANLLLWIYTALKEVGVGGAYGIAIILFTIIVRIVTLPFYAQQQKAMKKQQDLMKSKEWTEMQKKYAKDREKLAQEQMRLYRENGVNPLGGCLPALIPWPIMIGLYQSVSMVMGAQPEQLMDLAKHIYSFLPTLAQAVPVNPYFLGMDLGGVPNGLQPLTYLVPILVAGGTWVQQKMTVMPTADPQTAQMNQSMQLMMPLFIGYISLSFPIGLSLYWIVFNVLGIAQQYLTNNPLAKLPFLGGAETAAPMAIPTKEKKNVGKKS